MQERGPILTLEQEQYPEPDLSQHESYQQQILNIGGISGTIDDLIKRCPIPPERMTVETKNRFLINAMNESGAEIEPEHTEMFERQLVAQGTEVKFTIRTVEDQTEKPLAEALDGIAQKTQKEIAEPAKEIAATQESVVSLRAEESEENKATAEELSSQQTEKAELPVQVVAVEEVLREQAMRRETAERFEKLEVEPTQAPKSRHERREKLVAPRPKKSSSKAEAPPIVTVKAKRSRKKPVAAETAIAVRPKALEIVQSVPEKPKPAEVKKLPLNKPIRIERPKILPKKAENKPRTPEVSSSVPPASIELIPVPEIGYVEVDTTAEADVPFVAEFPTEIVPTGEEIDQRIQEILEFEPGAELDELIAQASADELPAFLLAEARPEKPEQDNEDDKNVFVELREYVGTLEIREPAKAEAMRPVVEEAIQIAELLTVLNGVREVDELVQSDAEIADKQADIEKLEARLEVVCVQLLESLDIEPTKERVQALIQELLVAADDKAQAKLSAEELERGYMHEVKRSSWFRKLLDDSQATAHAIGKFVCFVVHKNNPALG